MRLVQFHGKGEKGMQASRQKILEILKARGEMTVDELGSDLGLTTVTVRHHLDVLRSEGLVADPVVRHRATPGRPQYVYRLTEQAADFFPKAYDALADNIIAWIKERTPDEVGPVFEAIAERMSAEAPQPSPEASTEDRLNRAVECLNKKGYLAHWERTDQGYLLHTSNCPYLSIAGHHSELCGMDLALVGTLVGEPFERTGRVIEGQDSCSYFIPLASLTA